MNTATAPANPPVIQRRLSQAQIRYNSLRLLQHGGTFLAVISLFAFALLYSVERSWLTSRAAFFLLAGVGAFLTLCSALVLASTILSWRRDPALLAAAIEGARPRLQDRLNTLVFLEGREHAKTRQQFGPLIAQQAATALGTGRDAAPLYPRARVWGQFAAGLACVAGVAWFGEHYRPWQNLVSGGLVVPAPVPPPTDAPFELKAQNTTETAGKEIWGEVRIVEPGRDQKMTKLDVVPLRIEMAARDPLSVQEWVTSLNGQPEVVHALDPAPEPCFAAYSVLLYLDELKVSDWDLVSYYARAQTTKGNAYRSQIYFIEIRPFRDDLLKTLPGGAGGKAYQMFDDLTQLTNEQSRLLRETHRHEQMAYERPELQTEDRRKLAGAEADLAVAANHVYGKFASEMENADIGVVLSHLDAAEQHMLRSAQALRSDVVSEGKNQEQQALMELVATRKALQKAVSEHPDAFGGDGSGTSDGEEIPIADKAKSKLKALQQVAEFRNQEKAAQAAVAKLAEAERKLSNLPSNDYETKGKELAEQQGEMIKQLDDLRRENPKLFEPSKEIADAARVDMRQAKAELASKEGRYSTRMSLTHATDRLKDLNRSLNANNAQRDLERAYAMKKAIDQSTQALHAAESKPDAVNLEQADALAESARQSTQTLKDVSGNSNGNGGGQSFSPELAQSLSTQKQADLDAALQRFQDGKGKGRAQAAAEARANLENVSKAFDASRPSLVKDMAKQDALGGKSGGQSGKPGQGQNGGQGRSGLDALLDKLQSLALQEQNGHQLSPQDRARERAELLGELETTVPQELGKTDAAMVLLAEARQELTKKANMSVDAEALKHLQEKIETLQAEASEKKADTHAADGASVADASHAPASYRQRLERYYEMLSKTKP